MGQHQGRFVKVLLLLGMLPLGLAGLSVLAFALNLSIPAGSPDWLYQYQLRFGHQLQGDQLVGGGYYWVADGRDLWLRLRVKSAGKPEFFRPEFWVTSDSNCNAKQLTMVRTWFVENALQLPPFLGLILLPDPYRQDRQRLMDGSSLWCMISGPIESKDGQPPQGCATWRLYHPSDKYYYLRYGCYN